MRRRLGVLATLALGAALLVPSTAAAINVEIGDSGRSLFAFAQPGETNTVTVSRSGNSGWRPRRTSARKRASSSPKSNGFTR